MRPDKKKVVDEVWDEERILSFLEKPPLGDEDPDFSALLYAYRSMRVEDFERFLQAYTAAGRSLEARNRDGQTLAEHIAGHKQGQAFIDRLNAAAID